MGGRGIELGSFLKTYALGLLTVLIAVLVRWLLNPVMGEALPLVTLFGAVAAAVWLGGYRLAIPITLLGYFACNYLFLPPQYGFAFSKSQDWVGMVAHLFTSPLIIFFGEAARTAQARAHQRNEVFRITLRSIGDGVI